MKRWTKGDWEDWRWQLLARMALMLQRYTIGHCRRRNEICWWELSEASEQPRFNWRACSATAKSGWLTSQIWFRSKKSRHAITAVTMTLSPCSVQSASSMTFVSKSRKKDKPTTQSHQIRPRFDGCSPNIYRNTWKSVKSTCLERIRAPKNTSSADF